MSREPDVRPPVKMTPAAFHVLLCLADAEAHAYGMMKEVERRTGGAVTIGPGSLHFMLSRLESAGMIAESQARPDPAVDDPRRKYYELTDLGRRVLRAEVAALAEIVELARSKDLASEGRAG